MGRSTANQIIHLRFYIRRRNNSFEAICLETNIAVVANNFNELIGKISDSTSLYLDSFSKQEINSKKYIRKASFKYILLWNIGFFVSRLIESLKYNGPSTADYDINTKDLRLA